MPVGVFDKKVMKELLLLKQEFTSFMEWDASFAYTPSNLREYRTLCSAPSEEYVQELQKKRTQEFC